MNDNSNLIFDTDLIDAKQISQEEFIETAKAHLEEILKSEFKEWQRHKIIQNRDGLHFACPFCHDSATDMNKKRGHFLFSGKFAGHYKCFNCGKYMKISKFFRCFNQNLDLSTINYLNDNVLAIPKDISTNGYANETAYNILDQEAIDRLAIDRDKFKIDLKLIEATEHVKSLEYIRDRNQHKNYMNFLYDEKNDYLVILNMTPTNKVFGIQIRDLSGKRKAKYLTLTINKIYSNIYKQQVEIPEYLEALSTMFNIFKIDIYKPVIVTEGPMDAFLLPNAIATSGANKHIGLDLNYYYLYDSDKTGNKHALEKLSSGNYVFLWSQLKEEYELPDRKKWDVNDVINYLAFRPHKNIYWLKYFSNDQLDIINI